jgi:uncharacterized coiled-coil DUF342 family protein
MTTINTIEDLVRLLDEKPEWAEALRSRLQTRELTELPGKFEIFRSEMHLAFADLVQTVHGLADAQTATNDRLDKAEEDRRDLRQTVMDLAQTVKGLVDAQAETNRRLDKAEEERRDLRQTVMDLAQTVKGLVDAQAETNRRLDKAEEERRDLRQTVMDLAQTVKGLVDAQAETNRRLDKAEEERRDLRQTVMDLAQTVKGLVDAQAETNRRLDKAEEERRDLRQTVMDLAQTVKGLVDALTETNRRLDRVDGNVQELRSEFNGLRDDFGPVKAAHVRNAALREVADIARSIGCTLVKVLGPEEVYDLHRGKDTSGISIDQLKSFRYGDLIIEATDINGSTCYIAVEVSYTVDKRDTSRSVRNAEFLTLFTDRPAFAGVAGVRFDDEIASGSDGVSLYQVYARNLEVD